MRVPQWLTLLIAVVVMGFGAYRVWLSIKAAPPAEDAPAPPHTRSLFAGGFYRMGKRTHLFVGVIYLLLGGALLATSFGWNPFGNTFGSTEVPSKDNAPVKAGAIPIDQMPAAKK